MVGPAPEVCNGKDDDCDGTADDNLTDVGGSCVAAGAKGACAYGRYGCPAGATDRVCEPAAPAPEKCDDQSADLDCDGLAGCADPDCATHACDDRDPCTFGDSCQGGRCAGSAVSCTSDTCATRACNGTSSCTVQLHDGAACGNGPDCTTDVCKTGVCVKGTAGCDDGNPCTVDSCWGTLCTHVPGNAGAVCRPAAGPCDIAEVCDGQAAACPPDAFEKLNRACRASAGVCDKAEHCNGSSAACPPDALQPAGVVCRASLGACDPAETCTGTAAACPVDRLTAPGTVCRAALSVCDVAEICTGVDPACPADAWQPQGFLCRASTGACDPAESCTGLTGSCPADLHDPDNHSCSGPGGRGYCWKGACTPCQTSSESTCNDGQDNDCDGKVDCQDPDCQHKPCGAAATAQVCCDNKCRDLGADASNCGACNVACGAGFSCVAASDGVSYGGVCTCAAAADCPSNGVLPQSCLNNECSCLGLSARCWSGELCATSSANVAYCHY
jgi:hypothetical protein